MLVAALFLIYQYCILTGLSLYHIVSNITALKDMAVVAALIKMI